MLLKKIVPLALISVGIATFTTIASAQLQRPNENSNDLTTDLTTDSTVTPCPMWSGTTSSNATPFGRGFHQGMMGRRGMMNHVQINSEFEYFSQMIPHHEEAIATAQRLLEASDRPEMQAFAQDIIRVQSAEIEQMKAWINEWYPDQQSDITYEPMMRDLSQLEGDELDRAFLEDMIMHHMGAVMMSNMLINHGLVEHDEVLPFAQQIALTQRDEIHQMRGWLQDWYNATGAMGGQRGMQYRGMGRMFWQ